VDKNRLNTLIKEPAQITKEDYKDIKNLKNEYPYFQATLPLLTIASKKYDTKNSKQYLQSSAIYTFDRKHLKDLIGGVKSTQKETVATPQATEQKQKQPTDSKVKLVTTEKRVQYKIKNDHLPDSFFTELDSEMDKLKHSKEQYRRILSKLESDSTSSTATKAPAAKKKVRKTAADKKTKTATTQTKKKKATVKKAAKTDETHTIIEEIKLKEKKNIKDAHLKEQITLITNFIEKEPSLNKKIVEQNVDAKSAIEDLSETSTHLSDDVVSETLAKLMEKQGRNEKAIDIYKKLIWKFPQKKAYFADRIKELKTED